MLIVSVEPISKYHSRITFGRRGEQVTKYVRLSDCERRLYGESKWREAFLRDLAYKIREANRDFIIKEVGPGNCRKHPGWNAAFDELISDDELKKLT